MCGQAAGLAVNSSAIRAACANERSCGSLRGATSNGRPYRDPIERRGEVFGEIPDCSSYDSDSGFMRKNSTILIYLGLCGFLIGAALYAYSTFFDYTKAASNTFAGLVTFIACPPSLLFVLCIDCEVGRVSGAVTFLVIALMNAILYTSIGFLVLRFRRANE